MSADPVIIGTDHRGNAYLLRAGADRSRLYLAHKERDGRIVLTPYDEEPGEAVGR